MADNWGITVNPLGVYKASGSNNGPLPETCLLGDDEKALTDVVNGSTIVLAMPEFSATAPLYPLAQAHDKLRVGSMPARARAASAPSRSSPSDSISMSTTAVWHTTKAFW